MTEGSTTLADITAFIKEVAGPVSVVVSAWLAYKLNRVSHAVDGMSSKLVKAKSDASSAQGEIKGAEDERARQEAHTEEDPLPIKVVSKKRTGDQKAANDARKGIQE